MASVEKGPEAESGTDVPMDPAPEDGNGGKPGHASTAMDVVLAKEGEDDDELELEEDDKKEDLIPKQPYSPPSRAYAKLEGYNFVYHVEKFPITLGRQSKTNSPDCHVGSFTNVSRIHAELTFDRELQKWTIYAHGKHGILVNDVLYAQGTPPIHLKNGDLITLGDSSFYIYLPKHSTPAQDAQEGSAEAGTAPEGGDAMKTEVKEGAEQQPQGEAGEKKDNEQPLTSTATTTTNTGPEPRLVRIAPADDVVNEHSRPDISFSILIGQELLGREHSTATFKELKNGIEERYPYFKSVSACWVSQLRDALVEDSRFVRIHRFDPTEPHVWTFCGPKAVNQIRGIVSRFRRRKSDKPKGEKGDTVAGSVRAPSPAVSRVDTATPVPSVADESVADSQPGTPSVQPMDMS